MNLFVRALEAAHQGDGSDPLSVGAGPAGRGAQPLESEGRPDDDAASRTGAAVYRAVTGTEPTRERRLWLGAAAHYAFGVIAGACYGALRDRVPAIAGGRGLLYGTLVWIVADEGVTPALGLSRGPRELNAGEHAAALTAHWVYGGALDAAYRASASR
jgi:hypothetical protein